MAKPWKYNEEIYSSNMVIAANKINLFWPNIDNSNDSGCFKEKTTNIGLWIWPDDVGISAKMENTLVHDPGKTQGYDNPLTSSSKQHATLSRYKTLSNFIRFQSVRACIYQ